MSLHLKLLDIDYPLTFEESKLRQIEAHALIYLRELKYVHINISSNSWNGYTAENQEERLFFQRDSIPICVTYYENSEVQIAVFSKRNMLRDWKLVQRSIFCLSSTQCK